MQTPPLTTTTTKPNTAPNARTGSAGSKLNEGVGKQRQTQTNITPATIYNLLTMVERILSFRPRGPATLFGSCGFDVGGWVRILGAHLRCGAEVDLRGWIRPDKKNDDELMVVVEERKEGVVLGRRERDWLCVAACRAVDRTVGLKFPLPFTTTSASSGGGGGAMEKQIATVLNREGNVLLDVLFGALQGVVGGTTTPTSTSTTAKTARGAEAKEAMLTFPPTELTTLLTTLHNLLLALDPPKTKKEGNELMRILRVRNVVPTVVAVSRVPRGLRSFPASINVTPHQRTIAVLVLAKLMKLEVRLENGADGAVGVGGGGGAGTVMQALDGWWDEFPIMEMLGEAFSIPTPSSRDANQPKTKESARVKKKEEEKLLVVTGTSVRIVLLQILAGWLAYGSTSTSNGTVNTDSTTGKGTGSG
ncbi:hypothetical protein HK102_011399, partial [Quaeritorhiza haematococci]